MNVYLVRHGQKQSHPGDPGLTRVGIRQAIETGEYLKQFAISKILVSPFARTVETAKHIAEAVGVDYELNEALEERMNWDGKATRQEFINEWVKSTKDRDYLPAFGDSSRATGERMSGCINSLLEEGMNLVVVSHGGAIIDYLRNVFDDEVLGDLRRQYRSGEGFEMLNCAVNKVVLTGEPVIELLNFTDHLSESSE